PVVPPPDSVTSATLSGEPNNEKPTSIRVAWDPVLNCQYLLRRRTGSKTNWSTWIDSFGHNMTSNTFTDRLLIKKGTWYQYEITAIRINDKQKSEPTMS